jgi:predicted ATPase/transcriptional regulator with XRE-family HTH domain
MPRAPATSFATLLRRQRMVTGLTQEELAERAGLSPRAVSDLERGVRRIPYRETVQMLAKAMGLTREEADALEAAVPRSKGPAAAGRGAGNLPVEVTPLIGREREEAEAVHLIRWGGTRLLTLTGPGGVGKTRLAIRIAADLAVDFPSGVFFVGLAPLREAGLVVPAIARTLGVVDTGRSELMSTLTAWVRKREILLVLDNVEQVVSAAASIASLLEACPRLAVIATSRIPMHVRAEQQMEVSPLALPDPSGLVSTDRLRRYPAAALFIERARAVRPDFEPSPRTMATVAEVCRRLEGLPLAIELAAARTKTVSPEALLSFLDRRLPMLTGGPDDMPGRQQTMRDAIAWSYDLLDQMEQKWFREVAVFSGGFDLTAACAIGGETEAERLEVLDSLASLADKSLLGAIRDETDGSEPAFSMLETIREYGLERLEQRGETDVMHRRHAGYFLGLVVEAEPKLSGPEQADWLGRLERYHDNLRVALRWWLDQRDVESASRLAAAASRFWWMHGHLTEGRRWLEEALAAGMAEPAVRAKALRGAGMLALAQADYGRAGQCLDESLTISRQLGDKPGAARDLNYLAIRMQELGDYDEAAGLHKEGLALRREVGDRLGEASALNNLGIVLRMQADYEEALNLFQESLAIERELGDTRGAASTLHNLGEVMRLLGDSTKARALFEEGLSGYAKVGDRRGIAKTRGGLARVALDEGDRSTAFELSCEAVKLSVDVGDRATVLEPLVTLADIARLEGNAERSLRLLAVAQALRDSLGHGTEPAERSHADGITASARAHVESGAFDRIWEEGRTMTLEEAVLYAVEGDGPKSGRGPINNHGEQYEPTTDQDHT